jgi:RPA family protein
MAEEKTSTEFRRQTAYKTDIKTIINGVFVKKSGWESNYMMTEYGDFSRINVMAIIVDKDESSMTVDDGSGKITGRFFDAPERLSGFEIGDLVLIIGRPRDYNNQKFLTLEIVKKVDNKRWINYRRKELSLIQKVRELDSLKTEKPLEPETVHFESTLSSKERITQIIKQLDTESGASIDDIILLSKISNAEDIIQDMMLKGEVFELKPGKLKLM